MICDTDGTCWVLGSAGIYIADTTDLVADEKTDYLLINAKRGFRSSLVANAWMYREGEELYLCCDSGVVKVSMAQYDMTAKSYRMILDYIYVDGENMILTVWIRSGLLLMRIRSCWNRKY